MYPLKIKEKYDQNNLNNLGNRFTVVYLGTYKDGDYTEYVGSHPGVDIFPATKNQEVLACLDGKVFSSGEDGAYGKFIFLEHVGVPHPDDLSRTTTLYSCHEHLSEIKINIGDIVKEGDVIGNTGNTGNSFGEHLHFQIDKMEAPFHAYWPFTGAEAKIAGQSFTGGVNIGLGLDKAKMYTVNPLVYLDKVDEYRKNTVNHMEFNKTVEVKKETITTTTNFVINEVEKSQPVVVAPVNEEKLEVISSNNNVIATDPSLNYLSSLAGEEKKNFKDVKPTDKYYDYICEIAEKGFIAGYEDNTFRPNNFITRTEFLKLIFLVKGINLSDDNTDYFTDLKVAWQKKYVNTAVNLKIISTSNKKFNPNGYLTKVEALKMAITLFVGEINSTYSGDLMDVGGSEWFAKYVEYAIEKGLFPVVDNYFYPNKNITRYEVIGVLKKLSGN